jgi:hypothetical protein
MPVGVRLKILGGGDEALSLSTWARNWVPIGNPLPVPQ